MISVKDKLPEKGQVVTESDQCYAKNAIMGRGLYIDSECGYIDDGSNYIKWDNKKETLTFSPIYFER